MSIPRTRTFNNKKGFQAQADVAINSPSQTNSQSVNVIVRGIELIQDKRFEGGLNQANVEHKEIESCPQNNLNLEAVPLNDSVDENVKEMSVDSAKKSLEEMETLLKNKDNLVEALSLILDIYENNQLIVNKYIVAQEEELTRLLFL